MPIAAEMRALYPEDWDRVREDILDREGHRCKFCRVPDREIVLRLPDGCWWDGESHS